MIWAEKLKIVFPRFGDDVDYVEGQWLKELNDLYQGPQAVLRAAVREEEEEPEE